MLVHTAFASQGDDCEHSSTSAGVEWQLKVHYLNDCSQTQLTKSRRTVIGECTYLCKSFHCQCSRCCRHMRRTPACWCTQHLHHKETTVSIHQHLQEWISSCNLCRFIQMQDHVPNTVREASIESSEHLPLQVTPFPM